MNNFLPPGMTMPSLASQAARATEIEAPGESRVAAFLIYPKLLPVPWQQRKGPNQRRPKSRGRRPYYQ